MTCMCDYLCCRTETQTLAPASQHYPVFLSRTRRSHRHLRKAEPDWPQADTPSSLSWSLWHIVLFQTWSSGGLWNTRRCYQKSGISKCSYWVHPNSKQLGHSGPNLAGVWCTMWPAFWVKGMQTTFQSSFIRGKMKGGPSVSEKINASTNFKVLKAWSILRCNL